MKARSWIVTKVRPRMLGGKPLPLRPHAVVEAVNLSALPEEGSHLIDLAELRARIARPDVLGEMEPYLEDLIERAERGAPMSMPAQTQRIMQVVLRHALGEGTEPNEETLALREGSEASGKAADWRFDLLVQADWCFDLLAQAALQAGFKEAWCHGPIDPSEPDVCFLLLEGPDERIAQGRVDRAEMDALGEGDRELAAQNRVRTICEMAGWGYRPPELPSGVGDGLADLPDEGD